MGEAAREPRVRGWYVVDRGHGAPWPMYWDGRCWVGVAEAAALEFAGPGSLVSAQRVDEREAAERGWTVRGPVLGNPGRVAELERSVSALERRVAELTASEAEARQLARDRLEALNRAVAARPAAGPVVEHVPFRCPAYRAPETVPDYLARVAAAVSEYVNAALAPPVAVADPVRMGDTAMFLRRRDAWLASRGQAGAIETVPGLPPLSEADRRVVAVQTAAGLMRLDPETGEPLECAAARGEGLWTGPCPRCGRGAQSGCAKADLAYMRGPDQRPRGAA